jgi:hypothetical protein
MVGQLTIEMAANVARLERDMRSARTTVDGAMRSIQRSAQVAMRALGALGIGLGAMQITQFVRSAINAGDEMSKMAQRIGVATESVAGLQLAFRQGGSSSAEMQTSISRLTVALGNGNAALSKLNITSGDTVGALNQIADQFANMPDGAQKTALAVEIFGRSGAQLIPILNQGSRSLREYDSIARQLGLTIDTETGKAFEKFNDTVDLVNQSVAGIANQFAQQLLPSLQAAADALLNFMMSLDIKKIAQTTIDILTVLTTLVAGRVVSSIVDLGVEIAKTTFKMNAMGSAAASLRAIFAVLGGPVGVIASAVGLLYIFRNELGLTNKITFESADAIDTLKNSVNELSVAQTNLKINEVWDDLLNVNKSIESMSVELIRAQNQLQAFAELTDPVAQASIGNVDKIERKVVELTAALETAKLQGISLQEALQLLGQRAAGVIQPQKRAAEATRSSGKAVKDLAAEMQKLIDQYGYETDALTMSQREKEYANFLRKMEAEGIKENTELWIKYTEAFLGAQNERQFVESVIRQNEEEKALIQKRIDERLKQEEEYAREMEQINNQIGQSLTDALMNGGMKAKDMLLNLFKTLVLRPILQPIITGVTSMVMSGFAGSAAASGADSMSQGIGLFNAATAAKSVYDGVMGGFTSLGASFTNLGVDLGSQFIADFGYGFGQGFTTGSGVMANAGTMVGAAANAAAGIAGGIALGNMISGQFKVGGSQMATTATGAVAGAVIGSVVPVIGTAIGAIIGGALGGVVNRMFGMGNTTTENAGYLVSLQAMGAEVKQFEDWKKKGGWFRGDQTGRNITEAAQEVNEFFGGAAMAIGSSVRAMAEAVGVSTASIGEFSQDVVISTKGFTEAEFAKQVEDYLAGLETSLVDHLIPAIWEFGTAADKTAADILKRLSSSLMTVNQAFEVLGYTLYEASLQGASAASKLVNLFGGIEGFTAATSFYYENFYSAQEKINFQTEQLTKIFASFNAELPQTREQFRALVEMAQAAGNDVAFANLLQLAPAFEALHRAMEQLPKSIDAVTNSIDLTQVIYDYASKLARTLENELSYAISDTDKAFQSLVRSLEFELANKLKNLESVFLLVSNAINENIKNIKSGIKELDDASSKANLAFSRLIASLENERNIKVNAYRIEIEEQQKISEVAKTAADSLRSIFDVLQSGIDVLSESIDSEANISKAFSFISEALETARAGGALPEQERLSRSVGIATGAITPDRFASSFDMRRSGLMLQNQLIELQGIVSSELSDTEIQIQKADEQITLLELQIEQAEQNHAEQVAFYQEQLDALRGIDKSVLPLDEAISQFQDALVAEQKAAISLQSLLLNEQVLSREELLSAANLQIEYLNEQLELERANYQESVQLEKDNHADSVAYYQQQIDAMRGVDNSVLSVVDAVNRLNSAMAAERATANQLAIAQAELQKLSQKPTRTDEFQQLYYDILERAPDPEGLRYWINSGLEAAEATKYFIDSTENRVQEVTRMYQDILKRAPDPAGLNYWVSSGGALQDIQMAIATSREAQSLRGFANGGYYPGGMALVGERGPEIIDFASPGMVYNNSQLRGAMSGDDAAAEIRAMREDNQAQSRAMVALQNRMTRNCLSVGMAMDCQKKGWWKHE